MRRFFVDPENIIGSNVVLTGAEARHIGVVLRLKRGSTVTLFDGSGTYYEARLEKITPNRVDAKITAITPYLAMDEESRPILHLGLGLLKGKKMELVIQKITELGVASLRPFRSRYCAANDPHAGRLERWRKIAMEACKQCNRPKPPELHETVDFQDLLRNASQESFDLKLIFWEEAGQKSLVEILDVTDHIGSCLLLIGPEGGFSSEEVAAAADAGFQSVTLGRRILRAETAVIAAVSILQHELGNLG